jgi:hypothetical protein
MKTDKWVYIAFGIAAVLSTAYLLLLGYYALPTADDWGWARQVSDRNPFGFVKMFYFGWQGRFSALLIDGALCKYLGWNEHLLGFTVVELLLGYGAIYLLLRDWLKISDKGLLASITILITNLGVMAFPEIGTFYWLCTTNYIHEIWITLYLVWFMFCCKRTWLQWCGMLLCSVYLGACAENYSPTLAFALGCLLLYQVIRNKDWRIWKYENQVLLFVSVLVIGIGFLFMLFAPGNDVRMASEGSHSMMDNFSLSVFVIKTVKASVVLLLRLLSRGWYFICAFPLFLLLGAKTEVRLPELTWRDTLITLMLALGFIIVSVAATVFGVGWYATMRANCFITFVLMAWEAYVGVLLGYKVKEKERVLTIFAITATIAISITAITYIAIEYPIVRKYNHDVVLIHHQMQQYVAEGRTETVYVQPVEVSCRQSSYGYLRNALQVVFHKTKRYEECYFPYEPFRLESEPSDWRNIFYKQWLNAQFDIVCVYEEVGE